LFQTRESAIRLKKNQLKSRLNKPDSPKPTQNPTRFHFIIERKKSKKNTASNLPRIQKRNFTIIYDKNYGTIIQTTEVNNTVREHSSLEEKKKDYNLNIAPIVKNGNVLTTEKRANAI